MSTPFTEQAPSEESPPEDQKTGASPPVLSLDRDAGQWGAVGQVGGPHHHLAVVGKGVACYLAARWNGDGASSRAR